jgi:hypothetical protein
MVDKISNHNNTTHSSVKPFLTSKYRNDNDKLTGFG